MSRFILRYRGEGSKPAEDVNRIRSLQSIKVLDESSPRMLLVEGAGTRLKALVKSMPEWVLTQERMIPLPDPRQKLRKKN
ncbi:MAG: hypothetical protein OEW23_17240 [Candidatus Aminicenantes bacterium]|nr:hypothetical protein [Candidatus Aminicenantes bacterium]